MRVSSVVYVVRSRNLSHSVLGDRPGLELLCCEGVAEAYRTMAEKRFRTSRTRSGTVEDEILGIRGGAGNDLANDSLVLLD